MLSTEDEALDAVLDKKGYAGAILIDLSKIFDTSTMSYY